MVADPLSTSSQATTEYPSTFAHVKTPDNDHILQLPLRWEWYLRKKAGWLPWWDIYFIVLDGCHLSYYEKSDIDKHVDFTRSNNFSLPLSCNTRAQTTSHLLLSKDRERNDALKQSSLKAPQGEVHQIASFKSESNGKSDHHLIVTTVEKRVLHFMTDVHLEFVVWNQILRCALSRRKKCAGHEGTGTLANLAAVTDASSQEAGKPFDYDHPFACPPTTTQTTHSYYTVDLAVLCTKLMGIFAVALVNFRSSYRACIHWSWLRRITRQARRWQEHMLALASKQAFYVSCKSSINM